MRCSKLRGFLFVQFVTEASKYLLKLILGFDSASVMSINMFRFNLLCGSMVFYK